MSVRTGLRAVLARYDEDALVAWGNRGLLRRAGKDLEAQAPVVEQDDAQALVLAFGSHTQRFDARGPAHARCSCPADGVCQHLLAAVLWLQREAGASGTAGAPPTPTGATRDAIATPDADTADARASLHAELLAVTPAALAKHAGKPGYRWAWQYVQDIDPAQGPRIGGERNIVIDLVQPRIVFRYLGGGLDHLIADSAIGKVEKYRVAAVLAYQRAHGVALSPPEERTATASLDLGKDHDLGTGRDEARRDSRVRLRASVDQLLGECMALGLSHLSTQVHERYATLAVWAQGADYPRLALLLRRIADHVELLLERAGGADEHRLLEELAIAHALVTALAQAETQGQAPVHLVGRARGEYEHAGALMLWGLGALPWRAASGYVGLTLLFWSPASQAFLACTDARPESQRFDPLARYRASGPWTGLGAPAQATGRCLQLLNAQTSAAGRLSASDKTQATVQSVAGDSLLSGLTPHASWSAVNDARQSRRLSLLAEPQPMRDWVVLEPARYGQARFDATRQTLVWPLHDAEDRLLMAEIAYSPLSAHAIERIEALAPGQLAGQRLVARLRTTAGGLIAEPLSLIRSGKNGVPCVDALYFDAPPQQGLLGAAAQKLRALRRSPTTVDLPAASSLPAALTGFQHWLARCAERGTGQTLLPRLHAEHDRHHQRLHEAGLTAFPARHAMPDTPSALLANYYVCLQYLRLMGGESSD